MAARSRGRQADFSGQMYFLTCVYLLHVYLNFTIFPTCIHTFTDELIDCSLRKYDLFNFGSRKCNNLSGIIRGTRFLGNGKYCGFISFSAV